MPRIKGILPKAVITMPPGFRPRAGIRRQAIGNNQSTRQPMIQRVLSLASLFQRARHPARSRLRENPQPDAAAKIRLLLSLCRKWLWQLAGTPCQRRCGKKGRRSNSHPLLSTNHYWLKSGTYSPIVDSCVGFSRPSGGRVMRKQDKLPAPLSSAQLNPAVVRTQRPAAILSPDRCLYCPFTLMAP